MLLAKGTEPGSGPSRTRIYIEAARHGRIDHGTFDDAEPARRLGKRAARPPSLPFPQCECAVPPCGMNKRAVSDDQWMEALTR
jgi:hypothetical protein